MPDPHARPPADAEWIDTAEALHALLERLRAAPRFAIDTESNSMHAYRERICLVQVSLPGLDALVDPLAVGIEPLGELLAEPSITKVMHGADYDILCFKRQYGFRFAGLFDTMIAARLLGWPGHGLGAILREHYGFAANKKMQRFDWAQRPLPAHAIDYARYDTHFLLELADQQQQALHERGRDDEMQHACLRQTQVEPRPSKAEQLGPWRMKGSRELPPAGRGVLRALYELREALAEELDVPVFRVMADAVLMSLAQHPPRDGAELGRIKGLHPRLRGRGQARLWAAIVAGRDGEPPVPPPLARKLTREQNERFDALRSWRKDAAAERELDPDLVLGKDALLTVALADPRDEAQLRATEALDEWELARYGAGVLGALRRASGS
ncbi:MAG: HRDC domain-containing protein [Myxococcales bacterium]|nr:HRDC domain-containing protein [Myxococcales bacterium]MCB9716435.1 HRDC domain-containing protein [Myxococcales bacterium]